jgi:hypothetical protein
MAKRLQLRGGTTAQHGSFTGAVREVTVDTDKDTLVVHDGALAGGHEIANIATAQTLTNKTLTSPKIGTSILDTNGNELALLTATGSAVNELTIANAATTAAPTISTTGSDTNIDLRLNTKGTGGVVFNAGAVATPSITTSGDTNTGIFFPSADTIAFTEGGTEAMRIDSDGQVGIGTTDPTGNLHIDSGTTNGASTLIVESDNTVNSGSVNPVVVIRRNSTSASRLGGIYYQALNSSSAATSYALIEGQVTSSTAGAETGYLRIGVRGSGTLSDCFRFNSGSTLNFMQAGGGIYLGTTTPVAANLLDDYEEGTWTPTYEPETNSFTSITYDPFTEGDYTKIGRMVTLRGRIRTDAITVGTATGGVFVGGFPFTVGLNDSAGIVHTLLGGFTNHPRLINAKENTTRGILMYRATVNAVDLDLQVSHLGTGANQNYLYSFVVTYFTT